ncbi:MAG: hypothetical protein JTJ26_14805, partial [Prevotella sp.]|nr:hypothetical protein [Prevotella sp.]
LAQSKLASQGAGSEPSGSSENRPSQPGASAATATAMPSSGASAAASAASNAASYSICHRIRTGLFRGFCLCRNC